MHNFDSLMKVPKKVNGHIRKLCSHISPNIHPKFVNVFPEEQCNWLNCFINVRDKVENEGGKLICGWSIWEWPYVMVEAVFHAVWERPDGQWIDISPNELNASKVLFLRDASKKHLLKPTERYNSIRMPIGGHKDVQQLIQLSDAIYEFEEKHRVGDIIEGDASVQYELMKAKRFNLMKDIYMDVVPKPRRRTKIN